jgi:hypothetical protein
VSLSDTFDLSGLQAAFSRAFDALSKAQGFEPPAVPTLEGLSPGDMGDQLHEWMDAVTESILDASPVDVPRGWSDELQGLQEQLNQMENRVSQMTSEESSEPFLDPQDKQPERFDAQITVLHDDDTDNLWYEWEEVHPVEDAIKAAFETQTGFRVSTMATGTGDLSGGVLTATADVFEEGMRGECVYVPNYDGGGTNLFAEITAWTDTKNVTLNTALEFSAKAFIVVYPAFEKNNYATPVDAIVELTDERGTSGRKCYSFPFGRNQYDPFAMAGANYATVSEYAAYADTPAPEVFWLHKENNVTQDPGNEKRVLIHADHIYGKNRQVEQFIFDIPWNEDSGLDSMLEWSVSANNLANDPNPHPFEVGFTFTIRAITEDFDPATVTWNSAYHGSSPFSFPLPDLDIQTGGATLPHLDGHLDLLVSAGPGGPAVPGNAVVSGTVSVLQRFPFLLYAKRIDLLTEGILDAWNAADAIYGFEIAVAPYVTAPGGIPAGTAGPEKFDWKGFVAGDASPSAARCYAILK